MKVCASFGDRKSYSPELFGEIRLDVFGKVPSELNKESIITLCGKNPKLVPEKFSGYVDVGYRETEPRKRKIVSYHDYEGTPSMKTMEKILGKYECDIAKGAFAVKSFSDLHKIYEVSQRLEKKHVVIGMGELGTVTRIRQKLLKNEFTFAYIGKKTAEGQLSFEEMEKLGDNCKIVGLTGCPINHSLSPTMQNDAIKKEKINAIYLGFQSPDVKNIDAVMKEYEILGMNVTSPFKETVMKKLDSLSELSEYVGAVNTIVNNNGKLKGYDTDVAGVDFALEKHDVKGKTALVLGTGGAAKATICALQNRGCKVSVAGRDGKIVKLLSRKFGVERNEKSTEKYEILINCTPIGLTEGEYPADIILVKTQLVIDLIYGKSTPLLAKAKKRGCETEDGKKMLVGQGAESFRLWFGKRTSRESMMRSIS